MKEMRGEAEKFTFQAEVDRMMKLIINSLYRNKEVFLRELISNASDALDKIRVLSLTDKSALITNEELTIRIKSDKENNLLHITDTGIGMTKTDLVNNLGTIAKSGTSEFLQKVGEQTTSAELGDMIDQFGVGFYSSFLVADKVVVTSKHNVDKQHIWESDASSFNIIEDPRGDTLKRGTTVTLHLKEEARDFLEEDTLRQLIKKCSQFINFNIYLWTSKTETVEEPIEEEEETKGTTEKPPVDEEEGAKVEEETEKEEKPKTKKVEKTTWDWELINDSKPIWTRKPAEITDEEYEEFYKSITKDTSSPLSKIHFVAEGEVTFKSVLYIPTVQPSESFNRYGTKVDRIKLYVRRVFITDDFQDMMPNYLGFVKGVVDSDDLPLNVSRETLQQHNLLKVIKEKLVQKTLDMIKKIPKEEYDKFWKEYSTNIKSGIIEDPSNRSRLAKLVRFPSSYSTSNSTSLADYVERMSEKQHIYYMAGSSLEEVGKSPFVECLLKKGFEVLYLIDSVDEYSISALPEFEGKKFQNVAKDGLKIDDGEKAKEKQEASTKHFETLTKWLEEDVLKDKEPEKLICTMMQEQDKSMEITAKLERLQQAKDEVEKTVYGLQKQIRELSEQEEKEITEVRNEIQKKEEKLGKLLISLKTRETALTKRNDKIKRLNSELSDKKSECRKNKEEISQLQSQIMSNQAEINQLQRQIIQLMEKMMSHKDEIGEHKNKLMSHKDEIIQHKNKLMSHKDEIIQLEYQIIQLKNQEKDLTKQIASLKEGINTNQMTSLRRALLTFDKRIPRREKNSQRSEYWEKYFKDNYSTVLKDANLSVRDVVKSLFYKANATIHSGVTEKEEVIISQANFEPEEIDFLKILWSMSPLRKGTLRIVQ